MATGYPHHNASAASGLLEAACVAHGQPNMAMARADAKQASASKRSQSGSAALIGVGCEAGGGTGIMAVDRIAR